MKARFLAVALVAMLLITAIVMPAAAQTSKSLEIYIAGATQDEIDWFNNTAFPAFQKDHPDVKLDIITGGWDAFDATVAGWITTKSGPDIVYLGSEYAATFGDLLTDMDPYLKDWDELDKFLPAAIDTVTYDGHMRGLPILQGPRPMFYRTDLAADPSAVPPLTFADAVKFAKDNTEIKDGALTKQGYLDIGGGLFDSQEFIGLIWGAGGELYKDDGSSAFDSPETAEAMKFMYDRRRAVLPTETTAGLPPFAAGAWASNEVVSAIQPMWAMPAVTDPIWDNTVIAPYPAGTNGKPIIQNFIDWLSVPSYAPDPALAADFLKFIASKDNAIALNQNSGYVPVRTDAWDDLKASSPVWSKILDVAVEYGRAFSDIRASAELRPMLVEQMTKYLTDQQSLEDTQAAMKEEYDGILEDNGYLQ
jgi:multiple sugar transport system substrate-binding protein